MLAVVLAGHALAGQGAPFDKIDHLSPQFLALFALGVLAVKLGRGGGPDRLRRSLGAVAAVAVLAVVGAAIVQGSVWTVDLGRPRLRARRRRRVVAPSSWAASPARRVLASRPSLRVDLFSYSIYLFHGPIVGVLEKYAIDPLGLPPLAQFGVLLAFGLPLILWLSYRCHLPVRSASCGHATEARCARCRSRSSYSGAGAGRAVPAAAVEPIAAPEPRPSLRGQPRRHTSTSAAAGWLRNAVGLAVRPYAPAWKTTTRSPTSADGSVTPSASRSSGVQRQPTTLTVSVAS